MENEKLKRAMERCFHSLWNLDGREEAIYESRAFPSLASLISDGEMLRWAVALYRPLFIALREKEAE